MRPRKLKIRVSVVRFRPWAPFDFKDLAAAAHLAQTLACTKFALSGGPTNSDRRDQVQLSDETSACSHPPQTKRTENNPNAVLFIKLQYLDVLAM